MRVQCSILLCTYNRAEVLRETLGCLTVQVQAVSDVELIVVDNASTDETALVVSDFEAVRYVHESSPGLSHARNRAMREARSENLIFIDDDVIPEEGWLAAYAAFFKKKAPEVVFWGGPVRPNFEGDVDSLSPGDVRYLSRAWSLVEPDEAAKPIQSRDRVLPIGANFGGLRPVFMKFGFDPQFGRNGERLTSCEEMDLLHRILDAGWRGEWVRDAVLRHRVPEERLTEAYLARFFHDFGLSEQKLRNTRSAWTLLWICCRHRFGLWAAGLGYRRHRRIRHFVRWHYNRGRLKQVFHRRFFWWA
ncbi:MAG TPA: glycosyltransferase [Opitutales bacterium]|nr:glycosyltransferase [Opitutales bacterium]